MTSNASVIKRSGKKRFLAFPLLLALAGCGTVTELLPPRACTPPAELMLEEHWPRPLPVQKTSLREAIGFWAQDRADAANLAGRMTALQEWVRTQCAAEPPEE